MKTNKKRNYWYIAIIVILVIFLVWLSTVGTKGEKITISEFYTKLYNQEITDVYAVGGIAKVRIKGSKISDDEYPKKSDYYFTYSNQQTLDNMMSEYWASSGAVKVSYETHVQQESFLSKITPYLSIIALLVLSYFILKAVAGNGKSTFAFGKSKAKMQENVKIRFSDVAGADEEKAELQEIVEFLKNPKKFTDLGARIPKGVLLVGPPGTGKTLLAKAVAGESNVPFFSISGSDFVEMFVGVGASRVREMFDTAKKNMPCIVFIDEIDAVGRKRGSGLGGGNDEKEQTLNQLLVEMDGFEANSGIIVLAATNRSDVLDPALTRAGRFDRQIYVHVPDVKGREAIMKIHTRNKPIDENVDFKTLARITAGFSGADIENMLNEAAILAARENRSKIIMKDITEGINKTMMGPQKKSRLVTDRDKEITAYHESGHAILAKSYERDEIVQEVSIIPRGAAGGYTLSLSENDNQYMTISKLKQNMSVMMGGRIAEEIIFKDVTSGASSDIQKCTELARRMISEWGMSKKLGFVAYEGNDEVFIGRDYQNRNIYSEKTAAVIDEEISKLVEEVYKKSYEILSNNRDKMDEMVKLLYARETIYKDEIDMIMEGKKADEILVYLEERDKKEKKDQEEYKKKLKEEEEAKQQALKLQTAHVLYQAGVINKDDLEKIKSKTIELNEKQKDNSETNKDENENKEDDNLAEVGEENENNSTEENLDVKQSESTDETEEKTYEEESEEEVNKPSEKENDTNNEG